MILGFDFVTVSGVVTSVVVEITVVVEVEGVV